MTEPTMTALLDTPRLHPGWCSVTEALLHHTSRYYLYGDSIPRGLADDRVFTLVGCRAEALGPELRRLIVAIMPDAPSTCAAADLIAIVTPRFHEGEPVFCADYAERLDHLRSSL
ncbi:MAG: hypothetical protein H6981_07580 [Gammaproteobacteria bacterium]|nr:hypothetical protein [Gammaproteobacteria bacterium]MCP5136644.1 hypothetical protein [Gammaproteobacteria bacterium]